MNVPSRLLCASLLVLTASAPAADWPQWRGPNRDAVVVDKAHSLEKLAADPKVLWKIDPGPGQSSPVLASGRLVFTDAKNDNETAHCLDAATGKELWSAPVGPRVVFSPDYG